MREKLEVLRANNDLFSIISTTSSAGNRRAEAGAVRRHCTLHSKETQPVWQECCRSRALRHVS